MVQTLASLEQDIARRAERRRAYEALPLHRRLAALYAYKRRDLWLLFYYEKLRAKRVGTRRYGYLARGVLKSVFVLRYQ